MEKVRILDLFCKAGGCSVGYHRAFTELGMDVEITGVDIEPQKHYPYHFIRADAMTFPLVGYDFAHASPPCQAYSKATPLSHRSDHMELIAPIRQRLMSSGLPFIIENVEGGRRLLDMPIMLCGTMFGLPIWRHRYFETHPSIFCLLPPCHHRHYTVSAHINDKDRLVQVPVLCTGGADSKVSSRKMIRPRGKVAEIRWAMEIDWMTQSELTEAIPPAYTHWLGLQIATVIRHNRLEVA